MRVGLVVVVIACAAPAVAAQPAPAAKPPAAAQPAPAQKPATPPAQPAPATKPATAPVPPAPAKTDQTPAAPPQETYTYHPDGRRDPFQSLATAGAMAAATSRRGEGPNGLAVNEISVRGVLQSHGALVAMVQGPDNRTYIVHQGDKFLDGTIKNITTQGLIVVQEVNDPLSLVKQREIRKLLRSLEDAK
jgi:Tfp pilus assembly protein PilP